MCGDWLATCPSIENQYVWAREARVASHSFSRVTSENTTTRQGCVVGGGFTSSTASFQVAAYESLDLRSSAFLADFTIRRVTVAKTGRFTRILENLRFFQQ